MELESCAGVSDCKSLAGILIRIVVELRSTLEKELQKQSYLSHFIKIIPIWITFPFFPYWQDWGTAEWRSKYKNTWFYYRFNSFFFSFASWDRGCWATVGTTLFLFQKMCRGTDALKSNPTSFACEDWRLIRTSFKAAVHLRRTLNWDRSPLGKVESCDLVWGYGNKNTFLTRLYDGIKFT